eukprot:TRINITY_DN197_c0_g1_i2.p2 TRINITY_DN197_c0_g1~~TRINITY_DN197_c0_g1_i2.p2  ORF type:complete len:149 (+),score=10.64 TRINITY_DN197_c0_g1_i2:58-504(+)
METLNNHQKYSRQVTVASSLFQFLKRRYQRVRVHLLCLLASYSFIAIRMPYIENGRVVNQRSKLSLKYYVDLIRGLINFLIFFILSLIDPKAAEKYGGKKVTSRRPDDDWSGGGGGGRGGGNRAGRARIAGMERLQGTSGGAVCGAGG